MKTDDLIEQLEAAGVPGRKFWEDDLEMAMAPVLGRALENGHVAEWIGKRPGRQVSMLCRLLGVDEDASVRKQKAALQDLDDEALPYLLVDQFAKYKSKVAVIELAKGCLPPHVLEACQKDGEGEEFDTAALLFALYERDAANLRLVFHLDKIHKTGFARMKLKTKARKPARSLKDVLVEQQLRKTLQAFDKRKRDGRQSELKAVVPHGGRFLVFIRRANRPDLILGNGGVMHGYRPEWIILDFEEGAKRVNISSDTVSIPLEIANRVASDYFGKDCEYDNESEITYAKQIQKLLKSLCDENVGEVVLVELVAGNCGLGGSPKIKITDPDSNSIGPAVAHFEKAIGGLLDQVQHLESVKVYFRKKRVSLIFEAEEDEDEYVVRYSDHRLNAGERILFENYMRQTHGIPVLSTEKRFKR